MRTFLPVCILVISALVLATGLEPSGFSLVEPAGDGWFNPDISSWAGVSFQAGGGRTIASGAYVGSMSFSLHPTLKAGLDIGYARTYDFHGFSSGRILGGLDLEWQPSDEFTLMIHCSGSLPDSSLTGL